MTGSINEPHPNDKEDQAVADPEDFFEGDSANGEITPREPGDDSPVEAAELPAEATAVRGAPVDADDLVTYDDEPVAVSEQADGAVEEEDEDEDDTSGNRREYVVLQELVLDADILSEMLKAVKGGVEPSTALIEIHRSNVTTQAAALRGAWKRHKDKWDSPPRLVAVTSNKVRPRTAKPRMREVMGFDFED